MVLTDVACSLPYIRVETHFTNAFHQRVGPVALDKIDWNAICRSDQKCEHAQLAYLRISFNLQYFVIGIKTSKLDISLTILNFWGRGIGIRAAA